MKNLLTVLFFGIFILKTAAQTPTPSLAVFATGFTRACDITHCGDDRLFVVEQGGRIWILDQNGNKLPDPFLNIDPAVGSSGNEQGLLGLAFHPNYPATPYFYVNYTDNNGDTKVSRFEVSANNPNEADPATELLLLTFDQPFSNHNGGGVKFGPDGYLYIGSGDGGSGGDPQNNSQKRSTLLGKMLRIDVDNGSPYAVPASNPFLNDANTLDEIWALGLRNPWRFSFDRATGDLWIGDVGQDAWEEIDYQPASSPGGENYGWRCYEGNNTFNTNNCPPAADLTFPVAEYANSGALGCSVTGGFVYRGFKYPNLYGRYLYTDYCTGRLWSILPNGSGGWTNEQIADLINNQIVSFGENSRGELFVVGNGGNIWRLTDSSAEWGYTVNVTQPTCAGALGSIEITILANTPTPTVTWADGATGLLRNDLAGGTYSATIVGENGSTILEEFVLGTAVTIGSVVEDVSCPGSSDGSIDLTLGGTTEPPASVLWSDGSTDLDRTGLAGGEYTVTVTSAEGCVIEQTYTVNEGVTLEIPDIVLTMDSVLSIMDLFDSYQWLLNGEPIAGANASTYTATETGNYYLEVGVGSGCTQFTNAISVVISASGEIPGLETVAISPNPFSQTFNITLATRSAMTLDLSLTDLQGRKLLGDRIEVGQTATRSYDLSHLAAGTYLLVLKNGNGERTQKVLKL